MTNNPCKGRDYKGDIEKDYSNVKDKSYDLLKTRHVEDYQALYNRVELDLGEDTNYDLPTDKRLLLFQKLRMIRACIICSFNTAATF